MTEDTIAWLQSADVRSFLAMIHIAGMLLVCCAAVVGYGIGVRLLYGRGPRPGRVFTGFVHGGIVLGIVSLWMSGGALAAGGNVMAEWPEQMTFKLVVVAILSISVWAEHVMVLPWMLSARRPLAANLGWGALFGAIVIGSASVSCWAMVVAYNFVPELQAMPLDRALGLLGSAVGGLSVAGMALAVVTRMRRPKDRPTSVKKRARGQPKRLVVASEQPVQRLPELRQSTHRPLPSSHVAPQPAPASLAYRVPQQANSSDAQQLRDKLAQEWSRSAPARGMRPAWRTAQAEPDDRLLHDWLRRPG